MHKMIERLAKMEKEGLLEKAMFDDIPNEVYHACVGVSSSTIKKIYSQSFAHLSGGNKKSVPFRFGSAFHIFNNEPELFETLYKVSKRESKSEPRENITFLSFEKITKMSENIMKHPEASKLVTGAKSEISFFSRDKETGILKKCKVDGISKNNELYDLKTCEDASPSAFGNDARKWLYRISAAYYLNIVSEVLETCLRDFYLIPSEKVDPHACAVYKVDQRSLSKADGEIRETLLKIKEKNSNPDYFNGYSGIKELVI